MITLLVLVQTSDVVGADRGARVHEDAEGSVIDDSSLADCRNACQGSHATLRAQRCCIHEERHNRAGRVLVVPTESVDKDHHVIPGACFAG